MNLELVTVTILVTENEEDGQRFEPAVDQVAWRSQYDRLKAEHEKMKSTLLMWRVLTGMFAIGYAFVLFELIH